MVTICQYVDKLHDDNYSCNKDFSSKPIDLFLPYSIFPFTTIKNEFFKINKVLVRIFQLRWIEISNRR